MNKYLAMLVALFCAIASPAFANDRATNACTDWVLERIGKTRADAPSFPLGMQLPMPDGSVYTLSPRGATVWGGCEQFVARGGVIPARILDARTDAPNASAEADARRVAEEARLAEAAAAHEAEEAARAIEAAAAQVVAEAERAAEIAAMKRLAAWLVPPALLVLYYLTVAALSRLAPRTLRTCFGFLMLPSKDLNIGGKVAMTIALGPPFTVVNMLWREFFETAYGDLLDADDFKTKAGKRLWLYEDGTRRATPFDPANDDLHPRDQIWGAGFEPMPEDAFFAEAQRRIAQPV